MNFESSFSDFQLEDINPELLARGNLDVATMPIDLPTTSDTPDQTAWPSGEALGQWQLGTEDLLIDWMSTVNPGLSPCPPTTALRYDGFGQFPDGQEEVLTRSNAAERLPPNQLNCIISIDDSYQPTQAANEPDLETHCLGSSKALLRARSDTESLIITPTSSEDDNVPVVLATQDVERNAPRASSNRKRRLEEMERMTLTFPITEDHPPTGRIRKPYSPHRRMEVALARQVGACPRCRLRKVPFNYSRPCNKCQKAAGSPAVARWICIRDTFFEARFGKFDILSESFTREFLQHEIGTYYGLEKRLELGLVHDQHSPYAPTLSVLVREYFAPESEDKILYSVVATDDKTFENIPSKRYAIVPTSMPSMADLLGWVQMDKSAVQQTPVQRLIIALKDFISQYCEQKPQLPMHDVLQVSVKILNLVHCWRSDKMVVAGNSELNGQLAPKAISSQILQVIKDGIREAESVILKALEKPIYGASGPGEKNMIPLWACLWSLILTYRDCMVVYKQYSLAKRLNTRGPQCSDSQLLIDASKYLYDILTANYSALFRVSSPLYLDWRIGTNFDLIGRSQILKAAFYELRNEFFRFYETESQLSAEDLLLKSMIIDQEKGLAPVDNLELSQW